MDFSESANIFYSCCGLVLLLTGSYALPFVRRHIPRDLSHFLAWSGLAALTLCAAAYVDWRAAPHGPMALGSLFMAILFYPVELIIIGCCILILRYGRPRH